MNRRLILLLGWAAAADTSALLHPSFLLPPFAVPLGFGLVVSKRSVSPSLHPFGRQYVHRRENTKECIRFLAAPAPPCSVSLGDWR